jgi:hypothetical protein
MCFHFVTNVSMLFHESTISKLASCSNFFALMNAMISRFSQIICLGFLVLISKDFNESRTFYFPLLLWGPNVHALFLVRFMKFAWSIKFSQNFSFFFEFQSSFLVSWSIFFLNYCFMFRVFMFTHKLKGVGNSTYLEWHFQCWLLESLDLMSVLFVEQCSTPCQDVIGWQVLTLLIGDTWRPNVLCPWATSSITIVGWSFACESRTSRLCRFLKVCIHLRLHHSRPHFFVHVLLYNVCRWSSYTQQSCTWNL